MTELLKLSTIVERDTIPITSKKHPAGKTYEVANASDFGPYEYAILQARGGEIAPLLNRKRLTSKQKNRVDQILDEMVKMIVIDLEPVVLRELSTQQKQSIVFVWTANIRGAAEGNAASPRSTGSGRSRASSRSTAATPRRGGTRRSGN